MEKKNMYCAPECTLIDVRSEGVICTSIPGYENGGEVPFEDD